MNARVLTKKGARVKNNKAAFILLKMYVIKQGFGIKQNKKKTVKQTRFLRYNLQMYIFFEVPRCDIFVSI